MASIRSKCTTNTTNNYNNNNKCYAKVLDPITGSLQNTHNGQQSSRPLLRWSQSFSPTDRQKPNVSTLIRRKSAVERLAETKYNYIKSSSVDKEINDKHKYIQKSLSVGKTPLVILSQNSIPIPVILTNNANNIQNHNCNKCDQNLVQSSAQNASTQVVTRKRNSSLSSRLSEGSNNLEIQLRQLIADNEDNTDGNYVTNNCKNNNNKNITKDSVIKTANKTNESPVKPKPKERINTTNKQIVRQTTPTVVTNKRNTVNNKTNDKNSIKSVNSVETNAKTNENCTQLRPSSSQKKSDNCKPIQPIPIAIAQQKSSSFRTNCSTTTPSSNLRQLSISRSKSDVSNRLTVRRNKSKDEIERFFETLGLDSSVWDSIKSEATNSLISTPNHYFDSCESFQSNGLHGKAVHMSSSSSDSSTHSTHPKPIVKQPNQLNTRLMQSRSCHALSSGTSIVEKNARVIKWLYNCRKAMFQV